VKLSVFQETHDVASVAQLQSLLSLRHEGKYGAFWLKDGDGPSLGMFVNGDEACLYYYRDREDTGAHSLGYQPDNFDEQVDFLIENYQRDLYPRAMVVDRPQAEKAFVEFFQTRDLPKSVNWLFLE